MSAIWGSIDFSGTALETSLCAAMQQPFEAYKIDRFKSEITGSAMMGCGIQYIYENSVAELLPVLDKENGVLLSADAVLDNRAALVEELSPKDANVPDGTLLYLAWLRWGEACHDHLLGSYAFAVYNITTNQLTLATDHRATRCLYWCRKGTKVYFATLLHSILEGMTPHPALRENWVADYLSLPFITTGINATDTPFEGVYQMLPATNLTLTATEERQTTHWNPLELPKLTLENDDAYRQHFLNLMDTVAEDIAARGAPVGVYLSGGMDSAAIAASTAVALARRGQPLHTYTSVPLKDYAAKRNRHLVEDESEEVRQLCAMYPNMQPTFCDLPGIDALSILPEIIDAHELPLKSPANITWMYAMAAAARQSGCRVLLNGQLGNSTISYGDKYIELFNLIIAGHPLRALRTLNATGKRLGTSRLQMLRTLLTFCDFSPHPKNPSPSVDTMLENSCVSPSFAEKAGSIQRLQQLPHLGLGKSISRNYSRFSGIMDPIGAVVVGESNTKMGLANGVVVRDFSADKRIIAFCCTAPSSCFMQNGVDRRLIRDYMSPLLPPTITQNVTQVGIQSADWVVRLAQRWPEVQASLLNAANRLEQKGYVSAAKVQANLALFPENFAYRDDLKKLLPIFAVWTLDHFIHSSKARTTPCAGRDDIA